MNFDQIFHETAADGQFPWMRLKNAGSSRKTFNQKERVLNSKGDSTLQWTLMKGYHPRWFFKPFFQFWPFRRGAFFKPRWFFKPFWTVSNHFSILTLFSHETTAFFKRAVVSLIFGIIFAPVSKTVSPLKVAWDRKWDRTNGTIFLVIETSRGKAKLRTLVANVDDVVREE